MLKSTQKQRKCCLGLRWVNEIGRVMACEHKRKRLAVNMPWHVIYICVYVNICLHLRLHVHAMACCLHLHAPTACRQRPKTGKHFKRFVVFFWIFNICLRGLGGLIIPKWP